MSIMDEYIKLTEKHITSYIRLALDNKFIKKYSDEFLDIYIKNRYYDTEENKVELKKKIQKALDNKKIELVDKYSEKTELIEYMAVLYKDILYFDNNVRPNNIVKIVEKICKNKKMLKKDETFKKQLLELFEKNNMEMSQLFESIKTDEFELEHKKISGRNNIYDTKLKYNINFPMIYSKYAIQKAFETGNILESKLFVEYNLIAGQVLEDIRKDNIKRQYIIEFAETILKKKQKLNKLINIVKSPIIQEKISFKITNRSFENNKSMIYELMRMGFKFSILLDEEFKVDILEIEKLNMFKHVIVDKHRKYYEDIINNKTIIKNLIEI